MLVLLMSQLAADVHVSWGPLGWVAWVQPPHLAAGFGWVAGHWTGWFEVLR
jgi:hypothetical protein